jgi:hypothetical protein
MAKTWMVRLPAKAGRFCRFAACNALAPAAAFNLQSVEGNGGYSGERPRQCNGYHRALVGLIFRLWAAVEVLSVHPRKVNLLLNET